jgi:hypothetical protein
MEISDPRLHIDNSWMFKIKAIPHCPARCGQKHLIIGIGLSWKCWKYFDQFFSAIGTDLYPTTFCVE